MILRGMIAVLGVCLLAACEPEQGVGFTGIGATQNAQSGFALEFD